MGMKANRKFVEEDSGVSAVIGVILMLAITVAIAATVYVYIGGMLPTGGGGTETLTATMTLSKYNSTAMMVTYSNTGTSTNISDGDVHWFVDGTEVDDSSLASTAKFHSGGDDFWNPGDWEVYNCGASGTYQVTAVMKGTTLLNTQISL